jgi:hypothetical protein
MSLSLNRGPGCASPRPGRRRPQPVEPFRPAAGSSSDRRLPPPAIDVYRRKTARTAATESAITSRATRFPCHGGSSSVRRGIGGRPLTQHRAHGCAVGRPIAVLDRASRETLPLGRRSSPCRMARMNAATTSRFHSDTRQPRARDRRDGGRYRARERSIRVGIPDTLSSVGPGRTESAPASQRRSIPRRHAR